jgi:hypothetical protein
MVYNIAGEVINDVVEVYSLYFVRYILVTLPWASVSLC